MNANGAGAAEVAERAGMDDATLGDLLEGGDALPLRSLADVAHVLGATPRFQLGQSPDENAEETSGRSRRAAAAGVDRVYTDGSAVPNPGAGGWAVVWTRDGEILHEAGGHAAATTTTAWSSRR